MGKENGNPPPPYTHTFAVPADVWVDCPDCLGEGGRATDGPESWVECDTCQGNEGYLASRAPLPTMTITEWPPK